jgi:23S rRNA pseudouridine1911/1915/1917 synthase
MQVLWEDATCLVVNKPSGLLTQGPRGIDSLETKLRDFLKARDHHPDHPYVGLPHRLDRPVSGAVLIAKQAQATKRFCAQFASRKVEKLYWGVVVGNLAAPTGQWTDFMRKIPELPRSEIVPEDHSDAQRASLSYRVINQQGGLSLLEIELQTGRMHQIRLQAACRGHPILGDQLYGSTLEFGPQTDEVRDRAIALHAGKLTFRHPTTAVAITVSAPVPSTWQENSVIATMLSTVTHL